MSKQDLVHRATERASAPIGHPAVGDASPEHTPLPWTFVTWHVEEGPCAVRATEGYLVTTTASDADAELIVKAVNGRPALLARIATLEAALEECLEYFKDRYDVVDGSYGEPSPNKEMQLGSTITEALYGPGVV